MPLNCVACCIQIAEVEVEGENKEGRSGHINEHTIAHKPAATKEMRHDFNWRPFNLHDGRWQPRLLDLRALGPNVFTDAIYYGSTAVRVGGVLFCDVNGDHLAHEHLSGMKKRKHEFDKKKKTWLTTDRFLGFSSH